MLREAGTCSGNPWVRDEAVELQSGAVAFVRFGSSLSAAAKYSCRFSHLQDIRVGARNPVFERDKRAKGKAFILAQSSHNSVLRDDVAVVAIQIHKYLSEEHI